MTNIALKSKSVPKERAEKPHYTCMCCLKDKKEDSFFKSQWTKLWNFSGKRVLFCKDCIDSLMQEYTQRYGEQTALKICCAMLDIPFYAATYKSIIENNSIFNIGLYIRILNGRQFQYKAFLNSIIEGELSKSEQEVKEEVEAKWSKSDKQNMNFAIATVGYDPFDNCGMTDSDRRYCFNILAGYCDSDGIKDDGHKIQSVVQITQAQLQCRKMDEFINAELLSVHPDDKRVKDLTETKKKLLDSIAKIAQDNNLASAYNKNSSKGASTLSKKMKEMAEDGYEAIKVNLFDVQTCSAIKQISDISMQSILEQLNLHSDETQKINVELIETNNKLRSINDELEEENRMLKNKIVDIELKKKR